jgi:nucleotide-binding universal stress UspA family protein
VADLRPLAVSERDASLKARLMLSAPRVPSIRHIIFPYDFSAQCRQIVPFVRALTERFDARITLFSVVPPTFDPISEEMGGPSLRKGDDAAAWARNLQVRLDTALTHELAGLHVDRIAACGDPALQIVEFARASGADLIALPTHGVGALRALTMGSVTSSVLRDAPCAVWTATHAETQTAVPLPRTVLCAVDDSPAAVATARWAQSVGRRLEARLTLLHVVEQISDLMSLESERRLQDHVRDEERERVAMAMRAAGVDAPLRVAVGRVVETVTEEAKREQADLTVIGRGLAGEPFGRWRTHVFGIVQRSPCPVLSV